MTTLRVRPIVQRHLRACSCVAIVLVAGCAVGIGARTAEAQDARELRGGISSRDSQGLRPLPSQRFRLETERELEASRAPLPQYRPASAGAVPDEDQTGPADQELDGFVATGPATNDLTAARTRRRSAAASAEEVEDGLDENGALAARTATARPTDSEEDTDNLLTTGTVRGRSVDFLDEERNRSVEADAQRAQAIEAIESAEEDDPFAAPGIRVGSFLLRPTLQQGIEWTSNAQSTAGGSADFLSSTNLNLDAQSQRSRHSASLSLDGTYRTSITGSGFSEFTGSADADLGIDIGNDYRLNAGAGYSRGPEEATSPTVLTGTAGRALRQTLTASLGAEKHAGPLRAALTGEVTRNIYGDAVLSTGGTLSQVDRNSTLYSATLRGGYAISPALVPFVEVEYGRLLYDQTLDASGYARSANRYGARAGIEFDAGEKLNGEVSAGWIAERFDDSRLAPVSGISVDVDIAWSPMRGTVVNLAAGTDIEGSTVAGSSGSVLYDASLSVTRQLRANLTGTASLGAGWRRYTASTDRDFTLDGALSLTWWMSRYAGLTGRASHERVSSNVADRDSQTTTVYLGLTLRR
ncbi:MAG: outer membrane beta-barrel protein [Rhizobiaceae bacterium]|nr:outer membrane beta-barrel protein [Rhizobiaceae bacterium]